jgi:hypothetical protein
VRDAELDMAGFYCMLEPTRVPAAQLAADPVTACWVRHLETSPVPEGQTALFLRRWLTRDTGEAPSDVQAACWCDVKRSYLVMRDSLRRLYVTARDPQPYAEALGALGFYMLDETVEVDGQAYGTAVLDFGPRLIHSWLMRLVDNETGLAQTDLLDEGARELVVDGERVSLTPLEFSLLVYLRQRPDEVVTRPQLLKEVWGEDYLAGSNVVDVVVRSLRRKLGSYASVIETVTGAGYRYRA